MPAFIETQFPIARLSAESYKERKANNGQEVKTEGCDYFIPLAPRSGDVFQERLYCIRWIDAEGERCYAAPDSADLAREAKALKLLRERLADWQRQGFVPSKRIPEGQPAFCLCRPDTAGL